MSTDHKPARNRRLPPHPVTRSLARAIQDNVWPGPAAAEAFGLKTIEHAEALYAAVRSGEVTADELDAALGDGPAITRLVARSAANPHKAIEFETEWEGAAAELMRQEVRKKGRRSGDEN